ncbi:hypothetical protein FOZ63_014005 [Perkinsus olseni]|uniref:RING-type domain-containing protein n=1 Tax=Perkinsus olseni TaxID=32597 RepID=A0A7J6R1T4_PEROL|nr:hypothetical protein FOZ63_014005 [Perkinsus olseni]KAF4730951.1 hypothetical protein FOZ62_014130 [Perkinsus olseni]
MVGRGRGGNGRGPNGYRSFQGNQRSPILPIPQAGTSATCNYPSNNVHPAATGGLLPSPAAPAATTPQQRTPHKKALPPPSCLLTPEEQVMWANAPYACPSCGSPFMKWSQCDTHIVSSASCQAAVVGKDVKGHCEAFAAAHAGTLRPPTAPPLPKPPRKVSASGRGANGRGREGRQRVETEREIQAIKDEYEKAIFGGRRGSMSTVSGMSPSNGAPFSDTTDPPHSGPNGGSMDYHDMMGAEYGSSGFGRVCLICQMGESNCALAPCGHMLACYSCTLALQLQECPCCGSQIHQLIQVCPVDIRHYHLNIFNGNGLQMNGAGGSVTIPRVQDYTPSAASGLSSAEGVVLSGMDPLGANTDASWMPPPT